MFDTLRLLEKKVMMIMELEAKKIFDLATILEHLTEFHGSPLLSPFFFLLWGLSFYSLHSSSLQATWRAINHKLLAFSRLAYFLSYQDSMRLGLHITLGEVPQVTDSPPYPLTDYRIVFVVILYVFSTSAF